MAVRLGLTSDTRQGQYSMADLQEFNVHRWRQNMAPVSLHICIKVRPAVFILPVLGCVYVQVVPADPGGLEHGAFAPSAPPAVR